MDAKSVIVEHPVLSKISAAAPSSNVASIRGYVGKASVEGYVRIYPRIDDLSESIEIANSDIVYSAAAPESMMSYGATIIWVKRDANVIYTHVDTVRMPAHLVSRMFGQREWMGGGYGPSYGGGYFPSYGGGYGPSYAPSYGGGYWRGMGGGYMGEWQGVGPEMGRYYGEPYREPYRAYGQEMFRGYAPGAWRGIAGEAGTPIQPPGFGWDPIEERRGRLRMYVNPFGGDPSMQAVCQSRCGVCQSRCGVCQSRCATVAGGMRGTGGQIGAGWQGGWGWQGGISGPGNFNVQAGVGAQAGFGAQAGIGQGQGQGQGQGGIGQGGQGQGQGGIGGGVGGGVGGGRGR